MDWKGYTFIGLGIAALIAAAWFVSARVQRDRDLREFETGVRDTVLTVDTVWVDVIRIKTVHHTVFDTVYAGNAPYGGIDTTYVASADSANDRFRFHAEYAQPVPLDPRGVFQNIKVDMKDSVATLTITVKTVTVEEVWPIAYMIAEAVVFLAVGFWLGAK